MMKAENAIDNSATIPTFHDVRYNQIIGETASRPWEKGNVMTHFADRLAGLIEDKDSRVCVGLDLDMDRIPAVMRQACLDKADSLPMALSLAAIAYSSEVIEATAPAAVAIKIQMAYIEMLGPLGSATLTAIIAEAREAGLVVIIDGKRGDVEHTAAAYRRAYLEERQVWGLPFSPFGADAMTVNAYMGADAVRPYLEDTSTGAFVLIKTSNPSSGDYQDRLVDGKPLYERMAADIEELSAGRLGDSGYSNLGVVVGATYPEQGLELRRIMPHCIFLVPGYGAQGAGPADVAGLFDGDGQGALITASRSIIFAGEKAGGDHRLAIRKAAGHARRDKQGPRRQLSRDRFIGITTTVPVEFIFAAGYKPLDLNNSFITDPEPSRLLAEAELEGWPRSICAWIKGIYAAAKRVDGLESVIAVTRGDCSNAEALMEVFASEGVSVFGFAYPLNRERAELKRAMRNLAAELGAEWSEALVWKERLDGIRRKVRRLDELTWRDGAAVSGFNNHLYQVSCSDFDSDPDGFEIRLDAVLAEAESSSGEGEANRPRLGVIGVPTIVPGLYGRVEELGAKVVFNETQRQFAMPGLQPDIIDQYLDYTYPYRLANRIADIRQQIELRRLDGIIHYVQSFCHRQIEDRIFRSQLDLPVLTLEADRPGPPVGAFGMRLENFIEMLR